MSDFSKLVAAVNQIKSGGGNNDAGKEDFWRCETDKAGNGFAVIRFLPAQNPDDLPFVKAYDHGFQGPGGQWFIDKCPTTIGKECPVCEANGVLWNSGREADKELVRKSKRSRRTSFTSNVLIISDPKNPDNEGKIFKFKYGKKIFDKISDAMQPPAIEIEAGEAKPINPFDPIEGANFKLKIRKVEGHANFDKSEFDSPEEVTFDATKLFELNSILDESTFKSYDALKARFLKVTRVAGTSQEDAPSTSTVTEREETVQPSKSVESKKTDTVASDDDDMAFFRQLANSEDEDVPF